MPIHRSKSYVINLRPVAWLRNGPQVKNSRFYESHTKDTALFDIHMRNQHGNDPVFCTAIALEITFYFKKPATVSGAELFCNRGPYIGNYEDWLIEIMKTTIISDNKIIVSRAGRKVWGDESRVEFTITEV